MGRYATGGIHHVGSTAVPGLAAKPVIDILIGVRDLEGSRACFEKLERLGYVYFPYRAGEMHWFCKPGPARRTHHLHLIPTDSARFKAELRFRDRLRANPDLAREYATLKRELAERFTADREAYTEAKGGFVERVLTEDADDAPGGADPPTLADAGDAVPSKIALWPTVRRVGELYLSEFGLLFTIGIAVGIPVGLVEVLIDRLDFTETSAVEDAVTAAAALVGFGFVLFAGQLYEGIAGNVAAYVQRGEPKPSVRELASSLPVGRLLSANALYVAATLGGLVLLIVPGLLAFTRYAPAASLITIEDLTIRDAFRRSSALVAGSFWRVLLIVGLSYLVAAELDHALNLAEAVTIGEGFLADWAGEALATALLTPIAAVAAVVVTIRLIEIDARR